MPRLDFFLVVLEDNFREVMKGGSDHRGVVNDRSSCRWPILDCVEVEHPRDVEPVRELQWGFWIHVGDSINSVSKLTTNLSL